MNAIVRTSPPPRRDYASYVEPLLIGACQVLASILMFMSMGTLTSNLLLSVPTTIFIVMMTPVLLSVIFSRSALQYEAVKVLLRSPGGLVIVGVALSLGYFLWLIQPVLWANGYSIFDAVASTILVQIPLSARIVLFTGPQIRRIFSEVWYTKALDALEREVRIKRQLEAAALIQKFLRSTLACTKGLPIEAQMKDVMSNVDLRVGNMQRAVKATCDDGHIYGSPLYGMLYDAVKSHLEEATSPPVTDPPRATGIEGMQEFCELMGKGKL